MHCKGSDLGIVTVDLTGTLKVVFKLFSNLQNTGEVFQSQWFVCRSG
jgi:hypothetical protein